MRAASAMGNAARDQIMTTGTTMANDGDDRGKPSADHHATFERFMAATKWGVILVALALILMAIFLV
jgi:uncharacterized integral membrane protein